MGKARDISKLFSADTTIVTQSELDSAISSVDVSSQLDELIFVGSASPSSSTKIWIDNVTASAPAMSAFSQDLCVVGYSGGVSTFGVGISGGSYTKDENCERIKLAKVLNDLGMKVASVSILCQDARVFHAMENSGTPCPFEGKIGADATAQWLKYDKLRPDYNLYIEKLKVIEETKKQESLTEKK